MTMKCLLCYFSGSGNTKLACDYIAGKIPGVQFDFHSIISPAAVAFEAFDVIGFAAFADLWGPSPRFKSFVNSLPFCPGKPAFVFNSFGMFNAATLGIMYKLVTKKGFRVIAGHSLHMPENIATMIVAGMANEQAPNKGEMARFNGFIKGLSDNLSSPEALGRAKGFRPPIIELLLPAMPRRVGKMGMGPKLVDAALCTRCGTCAKGCPYGAIRLDDLPRFDENKCMTCWICYNHCPTQAIYTKKYRGKGHYPAPIAAVREKLKLP
jgi:ferredoxin/flavodoxin